MPHMPASPVSRPPRGSRPTTQPPGAAGWRRTAQARCAGAGTGVGCGCPARQGVPMVEVVAEPAVRVVIGDLPDRDQARGCANGVPLGLKAGRPGRQEGGGPPRGTSRGGRRTWCRSPGRRTARRKADAWRSRRGWHVRADEFADPFLPGAIRAAAGQVGEDGEGPPNSGTPYVCSAFPVPTAGTPRTHRAIATPDAAASRLTIDQRGQDR